MDFNHFGTMDRYLLMVTPDLVDSEELVKIHPESPMAWYQYGTALGQANLSKEAIDAFCKGLEKNPFEAYLYFGRGRRYSSLQEVEAACCDFSMAISLRPNQWNFWYYRATNYNLRGLYDRSISDFEMAAKLTSDPGENAPMVHWIYTTSAVDLADNRRALLALELMPEDAAAPQMDYGYGRCVRLYRGELSPDNFIDLDDMKEKCLKRDGRIELELNTMYYGLFAYHVFNKNAEEAKQALLAIAKIKVPGAFGYSKAQIQAKKMGITI